METTMSSESTIVMIYSDQLFTVPRPKSHEEASETARIQITSLPPLETAPNLAFTTTDPLPPNSLSALPLPPPPANSGLQPIPVRPVRVPVLPLDTLGRRIFPATEWTTVKTVYVSISTPPVRISRNPIGPRPDGMYLLISFRRLYSKYLTGISLSDTVDQLKEKIDESDEFGASPDRLEFNGQELLDGTKTLEDYNITRGDVVLVLSNQKVRKPVIYLFPPAPLSAKVTLALDPMWRFSVIYPIAPVTKNSSGGSSPGDSVEWEVDVNTDGAMIDKRTGVEVSYLFWEAQPGPHIPLDSPPISRPGSPLNASMNSFNPAHPEISPSNALILPSTSFPAYLEKALTHLGLHTEARTSFITFWLPFFLPHSHIAFRFLSQSSLNKFAPLTVNPTPDAIARVFLLFKGLKSQDETWKGREVDVGEDGRMWKDVVGVDDAKIRDKKLFRVLEWGGLEVV